jgi:ATPase subunit of ABC transporter with duplicated ATPase domains|uniref:ABC-F family ATP-binding cassette domain-containing protein n=1 Tax=Candidatus Planktophila sp. TaxID=2175601 RepID=UPI00404A3322
MGHIDIASVEYSLSDGRVLLNDVSFRVGDGAKVALIGPNGSGKTTLIRMICGDISPDEGSVAITGGLGVMRQFIGSVRDETTVRELLISVAPVRIRGAAAKIIETEKHMNDVADEKSQMAYAQAIIDWGDCGGYDFEVIWDKCCTEMLGKAFEEVADRKVNTLSGGEQKKLVLRALLEGPEEVLLLDEPDNYLDVPSKRWLEQVVAETKKSILFVSHDRELLQNTATRIVALEQGVNGNTAWVHGGKFDTWHEARRARNARFAELLLRWEQEHQRLKDLVRTLQVQAAISPDMANKYHAMQTRLRKFEEAGAPEAPPVEQDVKVGLRGGRTGLRALTFEQVAIKSGAGEFLTQPFDFEVFFGDRIAILGKNGTGKSHFFRMISGDASLEYTGNFKIGARVEIGYFAQTHSHPEFEGKSLLEILWETYSLQLGPAKSVLRKYEIDKQAEQKFTSLSGGQQARFQILLLELSGSTLLLLDEPTDNLDLASAESLEHALDQYEGTVLTVTHDRWFTRGFNRFLVFGADGRVYESPQPVFDF